MESDNLDLQGLEDWSFLPAVDLAAAMSVPSDIGMLMPLPNQNESQEPEPMFGCSWVYANAPLGVLEQPPSHAEQASRSIAEPFAPQEVDNPDLDWTPDLTTYVGPTTPQLFYNNRPTTSPETDTRSRTSIFSPHSSVSTLTDILIACSDELESLPDVQEISEPANLIALCTPLVEAPCLSPLHILTSTANALSGISGSLGVGLSFGPDEEPIPQLSIEEFMATADADMGFSNWGDVDDKEYVLKALRSGKDSCRMSRESRNGGPMRCPFCGKKHPYVRELREHVKNNHPKEALRLGIDISRPRCPYCLITLSKKSGVKRHLDRSCRENPARRWAKAGTANRPLAKRG